MHCSFSYQFFILCKQSFLKKMVIKEIAHSSKTNIVLVFLINVIGKLLFSPFAQLCYLPSLLILIPSSVKMTSSSFFLTPDSRRGVDQGIILPLPYPLLLPFSSLLFPSPPFSLPLFKIRAHSAPPDTLAARVSGGALSSRAGSGVELQLKLNLVHFK